MRPSIKIVTCFVFLIALLAVSCGSPQTTESESAGPENDLIGVWEIIGSTTEFPPGMNRETEVSDTHLPGIMIFTKKYFSWVDFHQVDFTDNDKSLPKLPEEPTDAQVAAVYNQLAAMAGTYEIDGSSIERHIIASKNPNQIGSDLGSWKSYAFEGDILTMTATFSNQMIYTLKLQRLE
jgi:hypothetical protein